jgi:transposase
MNSTQNQKITQITSATLIVGVDIAKFKHVARAQDRREIRRTEYSSRHLCRIT